MNGITVSFQPTDRHMAVIKEWLIEEEKQKRFAGFFCNWNSIEHSFSSKEIAIVLDEGEPVGFMSWLLYQKVIKIQIAEIKPDFRHQGYGRLLTETVLQHFINEGIMVAYLQCSPATSEAAWSRIGFRQFPDVTPFDNYNDPEEGRHLYRILVPYLEPTQAEGQDEQICLWAVERYQIDRHKPLWIWQLAFKVDSRKLTQPIVWPAKRKWNISWVINSETVRSDAIKYFGKDEMDYHDFLIIEELPLMPSNEDD